MHYSKIRYIHNRKKTNNIRAMRVFQIVYNTKFSHCFEQVVLISSHSLSNMLKFSFLFILLI